MLTFSVMDSSGIGGGAVFLPVSLLSVKKDEAERLP